MQLTELEKEQIKALPTQGYWSALNGVEIKRIDEDYVVCVSNAWSEHPKFHRVRIQYTKGKYTVPRAYIMIYWDRLYFDDCVRTI